MSDETILVAALDGRDGILWQQRVTLRDGQTSFTIGRSLTADVPLLDERTAGLHVAVTPLPDGRFVAKDLGTLNGIVTGTARHRDAGDIVLVDNSLQVGRTRLKFRSAHENLAPEKLDHVPPRTMPGRTAWLAGAGAIGVGLQLAYSSWLDAPRDLTSAIVWSVVPAAVLIAAWASCWSMLGRVSLGEWRWLRHAAIILCVAAVYQIVDGAVDLGQFMVSARPWSSQGLWTIAAAAGVALYLHLIDASGLTRRRALMAACVVPALLVAANSWVNRRSALTSVNDIDVAMHVYPPAWRWRAAQSTDGVFKRAAALQATADAKRKALQAAEPVDDDAK